MTIKDIFSLDAQTITNKELARIISSKYFEEIEKNSTDLETGNILYDVTLAHDKKLAMINVKVKLTH